MRQYHENEMNILRNANDELLQNKDNYEQFLVKKDDMERQIQALEKDKKEGRIKHHNEINEKEREKI